jgi:hypothetical protein
MSALNSIPPRERHSAEYGVTGKYAGCRDWEAVLRVAATIPRLRPLVEQWRRTRHPACLNAIMNNAIGADAAKLWFAFYGVTKDEP